MSRRVDAVGAPPAPSRVHGPVCAKLLEPEDIAWLGAFRILFGLAMCVGLLRFLALGRVDALFLGPSFHFKYWGFAWVTPLPSPLLHALVWSLVALALCIALGAMFRVSAALFAAGFAYVQLLDVTTSLHHYYLANLLAVLLAVSPAHRVWSVDAWLTGRSARAVSRGWLWLFRFQMGVAYTFAGLAKAQSDWLVHGEPLRSWLGSRASMGWLGPIFSAGWSAPFICWAGFLFDICVTWFLLVSRFRPFTYGLLVVFHVLTGVLFPIGVFPVLMILGALVFFPSAWPCRWTALARLIARRLSSGRRSPVPRASAPPVAPSTGRSSPLVARAGVLLGGAYCVVQVALPLRHLAYGGNVLWHEQGTRWSWQGTVREKRGRVTFVVRDAASGEGWLVSPRRYLTRLQEQEMSGQPDLILQLAHHVRDDFRVRTGDPIEVRVQALASLNGRPPALLIDPSVDLAAMDDGLRPASWITKGPSGPPPRGASESTVALIAQ